MPNVPKLLMDVYWETSNDCSGFLKSAAKAISLPVGLVADKNADGIISDIFSGVGGWRKIGQGRDFAAAAIAAAKQGYLVVALLKAADHVQFKKNPTTGKYDVPHRYSHGHVAVVLPAIGKDGYPSVLCGSIVPDGKSDGSNAVMGVWRSVDAPNVWYYQSPSIVPALKAAYQ